MTRSFPPRAFPPDPWLARGAGRLVLGRVADPRLRPRGARRASTPTPSLSLPPPCGRAGRAIFLVWWQTGASSASRSCGSSRRGRPGRPRHGKLELRGRPSEAPGDRDAPVGSPTLASTPRRDVLTRHFLRHVAHGLGADSAVVVAAGGRRGVSDAAGGYHVPSERIEALRHLRLSIRATRSTARRRSEAALRHPPPTRRTTRASPIDPPERAGAYKPLRADLRPRPR